MNPAYYHNGCYGYSRSQPNQVFKQNHSTHPTQPGDGYQQNCFLQTCNPSPLTLSTRPSFSSTLTLSSYGDSGCSGSSQQAYVTAPGSMTYIQPIQQNGMIYYQPVSVVQPAMPQTVSSVPVFIPPPVPHQQNVNAYVMETATASVPCFAERLRTQQQSLVLTPAICGSFFLQLIYNLVDASMARQNVQSREPLLRYEVVLDACSLHKAQVEKCFGELYHFLLNDNERQIADLVFCQGSFSCDEEHMIKSYIKIWEQQAFKFYGNSFIKYRDPLSTRLLALCYQHAVGVEEKNLTKAAELFVLVRRFEQNASAFAFL